tara:strand:- start:20 stop:424 length:405 start_codon:yes stop_codon:yes gene_type:complete
MNLILYNLIINSILVGVILITQIVTYPLFKKKQNNFTVFHKEYVRRISLIAATFMILELLVVIILLVNNFEDNLIKLLAVLIIIIWTSTFVFQVPLHNHLSIKQDLKKINILIQSNWIRTVCWCLKLMISILIL